MNFFRHFWLLFASWDSNNGFSEARGFCVFPPEIDNISTVDLRKVCTKEIDERVWRIWRLNIQPAMADKAPNGIASGVRANPGKGCPRAPKYGHGMPVAYNFFPCCNVEFGHRRLRRLHADETRVSAMELAKINPQLAARLAATLC
jgi:hypothetical protein